MEDAGHPFLETKQGQQKIWLLSVPKYLGELWLKPESINRQQVGQIKLEQVQILGKRDLKVTYILDENLSVAPPDPKKPRNMPTSQNLTKIPREHEFTFQSGNSSQLLGVISKTKTPNENVPEVRKLEGMVA